MLPWALPAQPAFISIHWMLIYPGYIDALCWHLFGFDGPDWFNNYWSALGSNILASSPEDHAVLDLDPAGGEDGDPTGSV